MKQILKTFLYFSIGYCGICIVDNLSNYVDNKTVRSDIV